MPLVHLAIIILLLIMKNLHNVEYLCKPPASNNTRQGKPSKWRENYLSELSSQSALQRHGHFSHLILENYQVCGRKQSEVHVDLT